MIDIISSSFEIKSFVKKMKVKNPFKIQLGNKGHCLYELTSFFLTDRKNKIIH